jgi:signal transduction histidine kinase
VRIGIVGAGLIGVLCAGVSCVPLAALAQSEPVQARKQILLLYDEDRAAFPGLASIDRRLRESFRSELGTAVDFHSESLNISHFQRADYDRILADYYQRKYARRKLDLIVAVLEPSLDFLLRHGEALFPGVPIVFCGIEASTIQGKTLRPNITGVLLKRAFPPTLELALRLQPDTRNVFVVGGTSTFDRYLLTIARRDLQPYEGRVAITYLVDLPMEALLRAVSSLPARSVILFTTVFTDGAGRGFVPHEALSSVASAANVPVYVALDQYVGIGAVGGNVYSLDTHGEQAAGLGLRIVRGAKPASLPVLELGSQIDLLDARQLRRWGLDETRLPSGSIVRYRDPSAWQLYRWYIVAAIALLLIQSALISGLLLARLRRQQAEAEAGRQREELAHVLRVTTIGELTASLAHEISQPLSSISLNAQAVQQLLGRGPAEAQEVGEALSDILADARRAGQIIERVRVLFRKQHAEPAPVDVNALIEDVVRLLRNAMLARRIDVRLMLRQGTSPVLGDPVQLEQVVLNVLLNASDAIDAAEHGPRVITILTSQPQAGRLSVEVADTGVGVKDAELELIFEHFVTTKPQGLGMGLAISRSIINAHAGRIWATRNPHRGLTMHIELPTATKSKSNSTDLYASSAISR